MLSGYDAHPAGAPESVQWSARVCLTAPDFATASLPGHSLTITQPVSFHPQPVTPAALDTLLVALGGEILSGFARAARRAGLTLDNAEILLTCRLENPLVAAGVLGETGSPAIAQIHLTLFVATPHAEADAQSVLSAVLARAPVYATLSRACPVTVQLKILY